MYESLYGQGKGQPSIYSSGSITSTVEFLVLRGGKFWYSVSLIASQQYNTRLIGSILNKTTIFALFETAGVTDDVDLVAGDIVRMEYSTQQPSNLFPKESYSFNFSLGTIGQAGTASFEPNAVVSNPITLTVT